MFKLKPAFFVFPICVICILISVISSYASEESLTITTYYPSPYGVYNELRLYPHSPATTACNSTQEGNTYYDLNAHNLYVCRYNGTTYAWESGGGGGYWAASGNNIYNTNTGNVGIGTTSLTTSRLTVNGEIFASGVRGLCGGIWLASSGVNIQQTSGSGPCDGGSLFLNGFPLRLATGGAEKMRIDYPSGNVGIGTPSPKSALHVVGLPVYANNAAAIAGGLTAGAFYRTGGNPDPVCVVH